MTKVCSDVDERKFFESTVHGLRSRGWSKIDAESEALDRIERLRAQSQGKL